MGINVFPVPSSAAVTPTGWTAGVAGTFTLSSTLTAGTYLIETDATQTMTITLQDSAGHRYAGTIRGGSGFITVATAVNQIIIPGSLTYPFGIQITPISVTQLAAPTSLSIAFNTATGVTTGTWGTAPANATGAVLFTPTGSVLNFSSTASGATTTLVNADFNNNATNQLVVAFKNSSGAVGLGSTFSLYMPVLPPATTTVDYVLVAGGGAGGSSTGGGGGGGAGGYLASTGFAVSSSFTVTVGGGGSNSVLHSLTATAGGAGQVSTTGSTGGSGGGGHSSANLQAGGAGTAGQGNAGGSGTGNFSGAAGAGGGGGAGGNGANSPTTATGGAGGAGAASSITGTSTGYAGGGGGCGTQYGNPSFGAASSGGGSNAAGTANTGGGGGGRNTSTAYAGGSGVVIIAYPDTNRALTSIGAGLTYDEPTRAGYRVYRFTAGTGTVTT